MSLVRFFESDPIFEVSPFGFDPFDKFFRGSGPLRHAHANNANNAASSNSDNLVWAPRCDVSSHDKEIVVTAELAGVPKDQIHVTVENNMLLVEAETKRETEESDPNKTWHRQERRYGLFRRTFQLPKGVDPEKVNATVDNGILTVTIPNPEPPKVEGPKKIAIQ